MDVNGEYFQLISDLHLESGAGYATFVVEPCAPLLGLLGDIGNTCDDQLYAFLEIQLRQFQVVFYVLGNHEPYRSSFPAAKKRLTEFRDSWERKRHADTTLGEFVFLDQTRYDINEKVTVLGCTLFSDITPEQSETVSFGMWDFYDIEGWTVDDHKAAHESDVEWLRSQLRQIPVESPMRNIIVMTHYSPTTATDACDPQHRASKISSCFASNLVPDNMNIEGITTWAFGHTHYNCDFMMGKMRVCTNQRGYYFKLAEGFDGRKVICM